MIGVVYNQIVWKIIKWNSVYVMMIIKSNSKFVEVNNVDGIVINIVSRGLGVSLVGLVQYLCQLLEVNENDNGGGNKYLVEVGYG